MVVVGAVVSRRSQTVGGLKGREFPGAKELALQHIFDNANDRLPLYEISAENALVVQPAVQGTSFSPKDDNLGVLMSIVCSVYVCDECAARYVYDEIADL